MVFWYEIGIRRGQDGCNLSAYCLFRSITGPEIVRIVSLPISVSDGEQADINLYAPEYYRTTGDVLPS